MGVTTFNLTFHNIQLNIQLNIPHGAAQTCVRRRVMDQVATSPCQGNRVGVGCRPQKPTHRNSLTNTVFPGSTYARGWEGEVHCEPAKRRGLSCPGHSEAFTWGSRRWIEVHTGKRGAKRERWVSGVARLGGGYGGGGEGSTWPKVKLVTGEWDREGNIDIHGVTDRANQKFQTERSSEHRSEGGSGSMPRAGQSWRCLGRCLGRPDSPSLSLSQGLNCDMA